MHFHQGQSVVQCKRKGQTVKAPDAVKQPEPAPDLMAALEQALAEMNAESEGKGPQQGKQTGGEMTHSDDDKRPEEETQEDGAPDEKKQADPTTGVR